MAWLRESRPRSKQCTYEADRKHGKGAGKGRVHHGASCPYGFIVVVR